MKHPRLGPDWSQLWDIVALLSVDKPLDSVQRHWLVDLLHAVADGEDVSKRFTVNKKPSPNAERHFWIACDVARHIHEGKRPARDLVAERWGESVENIEQIVKRQRPNTDAISRALYSDGFDRLIERQRERL